MLLRQSRSLLVLGYPKAYNAADHVPEILVHKPIGLEGFDSHLVENIGLLLIAAVTWILRKRTIR